MLIDSNVFLGPWPFAPIPEPSPASLQRQLKAAGIGRALVSPLAAVFQPDPMPANRRLFAALGRQEALVPVPVINLALANWEEQLDECLAHGVPAVRLLPNYHNYRLTHARVDAFMAGLDRTKLRLIVNVRLQDERTQYFALQIKGVPVPDLAAFLQRHPRHHPLITGLFRPELKQLATARENFSTDIAFCEWRHTVADLLTVLPTRRLFLGTCTPLLSTRGQVDKLRLAFIPAAAKRTIGTTNAVRFFRL